MSLHNGNFRAYDCETLVSLVADYAFGLTSDEETRLVEDGLPHCPEAAAELADYRRIQDEMRGSVPQVEPPPLLGERLLAAIATPAAVAVMPAPRRALSWAWLAAAAALIVLVLSNAYWVGVVRGYQQLHAQNVALPVNTSTDTNTTFVLSSPADLHWVRLPPLQQDSGASAFLLWNAESETGLLYVVGFETNTDQIYQLWLTRGEARTSAGNFHVDETGKGVLLFRIDEPIDEYTWARITEESDYDAPQPSGQVVVNGELQT